MSPWWGMLELGFRVRILPWAQAQPSAALRGLADGGDLVRSQQDGKSPPLWFIIPTGFLFPSVLTYLVGLWVLSNNSEVSLWNGMYREGGREEGALMGLKEILMNWKQFLRDWSSSYGIEGVLTDWRQFLWIEGSFYGIEGNSYDWRKFLWI